MKSIYASTLLLLATLAMSCGGAPAGGSCTVVSGGFTTCIEYTGSAYTTATGQSACTSSAGTYSASSCTTSGRVGSCQLYSGQPTEQYIRYFTGYDNTTAQQSCAGFPVPGTYTSG